jgi:hypothetical protein
MLEPAVAVALLHWVHHTLLLGAAAVLLLLLLRAGIAAGSATACKA